MNENVIVEGYMIYFDNLGKFDTPNKYLGNYRIFLEKQDCQKVADDLNSEFPYYPDKHYTIRPIKVIENV